MFKKLHRLLDWLELKSVGGLEKTEALKPPLKTNWRWTLFLLCLLVLEFGGWLSDFLNLLTTGMIAEANSAYLSQSEELTLASFTLFSSLRAILSVLQSTAAGVEILHVKFDLSPGSALSPASTAIDWVWRGSIASLSILLSIKLLLQVAVVAGKVLVAPAIIAITTLHIVQNWFPQWVRTHSSLSKVSELFLVAVVTVYLVIPSAVYLAGMLAGQFTQPVQSENQPKLQEIEAQLKPLHQSVTGTVAATSGGDFENNSQELSNVAEHQGLETSIKKKIEEEFTKLKSELKGTESKSEAVGKNDPAVEPKQTDNPDTGKESLIDRIRTVKQDFELVKTDLNGNAKKITRISYQMMTVFLLEVVVFPLGMFLILYGGAKALVSHVFTLQRDQHQRRVFSEAPQQEPDIEAHELAAEEAPSEEAPSIDETVGNIVQPGK